MIGLDRILRLGGSNNRQVFDGGKYISLEKQISNGILRVQCGAGKGFPQVYLIILNRFAGCAGKKVRRDVPCYVPMLHYYVDYAGRVTFCCSANMDSPDCKPLIMGNAKENTVFEIYSSPQAKKFRKAMLTMKNMPSCCAVCDAQTGYCMNTAYQQNPYHPFFEQQR